jgi:hypothetical protein
MLSVIYQFFDKFYPDFNQLCGDEGYYGSPHIDGQDKYRIRIDIFKTEGARSIGS